LLVNSVEDSSVKAMHVREGAIQNQRDLMKAQFLAVMQRHHDSFFAIQTPLDEIDEHRSLLFAGYVVAEGGSCGGHE